jgi:hypothetical protein
MTRLDSTGSYTAYRLSKGQSSFDDRSTTWDSVPRTATFCDMATGAPALYETTSAILWDDDNLYIRFWVEEPYPVATQTERDCLIFRENDIEIFIDGGDCYYEFEISALGTIYEVFFIWKDAFGKGGRFDLPEFNLYEREAFSFGGNFDRTNEHFWRGTHPRGVRWAFLDWDFPGLKTQVWVEGELNNPDVKSKGWHAEVTLPWAGMKHLADGRSLPPRDGDIWKLFLGRFQIINVGGQAVQAAWCATPHGVYDTHMPEKFTPIVFSTTSVNKLG